MHYECSDTQYTLEMSYFGRVQVLQYGIQGYVCNDGWDDNSAKVMCKQQGYAGGVALGASHDYTYTPEPFWISEVKCNGKESKLTDCSLNDKGAMCKREASVLCYKQGKFLLLHYILLLGSLLSVNIYTNCNIFKIYLNVLLFTSFFIRCGCCL